MEAVRPKEVDLDQLRQDFPDLVELIDKLPTPFPKKLEEIRLFVVKNAGHVTSEEFDASSRLVRAIAIQLDGGVETFADEMERAGIPPDFKRISYKCPYHHHSGNPFGSWEHSAFEVVGSGILNVLRENMLIFGFTDPEGAPGELRTNIPEGEWWSFDRDEVFAPGGINTVAKGPWKSLAKWVKYFRRQGYELRFE